jgi:ligand-binding SRPBCC domain-containing protein
VHVRLRTTVAAPPATVWARVTTAQGIDDEMRPWLRMRFPRRWRGHNLDEVPVGQPLGRAWLLLFGFIPVEYDDLRLEAVVSGRSFHERSTMLLMSQWWHDREVVEQPDGSTAVVDTLAFELRRPLRAAGPVAERVVRALFGHRHRRLRRHLGERH